MQPISATGKNQSGYTLLEVLAVLILIGFIGTLAFPVFFRSEEKLVIDKIEDILRNDWERLQQEAMVSKMNHAVIFDNWGYAFTIGANRIHRSFQKYNFNWNMSGNDDRDDETETSLQAGATDLIFNTNGSCTAGEWGWETPRFRGVMVVNHDGTMEWKYERK